MSERKKPSQVAALRIVEETDAGTVELPEPDAFPFEGLLDKWNAATFAGESVLSGIKPRRWIVEGWLPLDAVGAIIAPAGKGKSFYALSLALELARGGTFAGEKLEASPVLYVAAERPTDIRDRLEAWQAHHDRKAPEAFRVFAPTLPPQLTAQDHLEALCEKVRREKPRVVVLDTFARMTLGLEENSSRDMGQVMEALDRIRHATGGGLVLVVHHTGKDPSRGARGSTAFLGAIDFQITLDGDAKALEAKVTKSNAGPQPLPEWYKIEAAALPAAGEIPARSVGVLVPTAPSDAGSDHDSEVVAILTDTYPEGAGVVRILEALGYDIATQKRKHSALSKRLNVLAKRGILEKRGAGARITWHRGPLSILKETGSK